MFSDYEKENSFGYDDCKQIYSEWALGKRVVESIVNFSLSTDREILIPNAPLEVAEQYIKTCEKYNIIKTVRNCLFLTRVYGMAGIYVASDSTNDDCQNLTVSELTHRDIRFNVLDPLNMNVVISQNPLDFNFQRPACARVGSKNVGNRRVFVATNGSPLYIKFEQSALNFSGRSVFANMKRLIELWTNLFEALERISLKASSILITNDNAGMKDAFTAKVAEASAMLLKQMKQGQVGILNKGQTAEFFNLNGASEIGAMISEVKEGLAMALNDTPTAILLDKSMSNGLSEGSEDMRAVIMAVNNFRRDYINPILQFIDSYLFFKAWDNDFIEDMRLKYGDKYSLLPNNQIRQMWIDDFKFEWKSIYPKTPDEETKAREAELNRLLLAKELGVDLEDIEQIANENGLFSSEIHITKKDFDDSQYQEMDLVE